jgi:uncharacterized protein YukE
MKRIRVNTEELKAKSKDFDSAASLFSSAGEEILAVAMSMPSYDGQLSGPARTAGSEIQSQGRSLNASLSNDAESLSTTAKEFEVEDNKTINLFQENLADISAPYGYYTPGTEFDVPIKKGGNHDWLGYEEHGSYVVIWRNGESVTIYITEENRELIDQYEKAVGDYCKALAETVSIYREVWSGSCDSITIAMFLLILVCAGILIWEFIADVLVGMGLTATQIDKIKKTVESAMTGLGIAQGATGTDVADIMEHLGLDPLDPWQIDEIIKKYKENQEIALNAENDAVNIYNTLAPPPTPESTPTTSEPTTVRPPTPPSPTPPTPTQTPPPT